ncbi:peptidylprolyl isomerase [Bremerella sp. JC817]|uniref:peptidylprolyl isomerase n=1 Tax=Bremerella sp. JC817 TaxID=3231756 RepID=UPI00345AD832
MKSPHLSWATQLGLAFGFILLITGCGGSDAATPPAASIGDPGANALSGDAPTMTTEMSISELQQSDFRGEEFPEVVLTTTMGKIRLRLDAKKAPATVDNFLTNYVATKHYDGTIFHYVHADRMVLGGLFDSNMSPRDVRSEIQNEATNGLKNKRGTIAMSRDPNFIHSSTCQFFINCADNEAFDHIGNDDSSSYGYCVFGEVIDGMEVADAISQVEVETNDGFANLPRQPVQILSAERVK